MSRSYKNTKFSVGKVRGIKGVSNMMVRSRTKNAGYELANGGAYKKICHSMDLSDDRPRQEFQSWPDYWKGVMEGYAMYREFFPEANMAEPNKKREYRRWLSRYRNK